MTENRPIKRHTALQSFSKEHHYGLLLSWKIRQGLKSEIPIGRIWKYVDWFWQKHLSGHFEDEETILFPILSEENKNIKKAISQHKRLKRLFQSSPKDIRILNSIEEELEQHIRFEERILFNEIQEVANDEQLKRIEELHQFSDEEEWKDEFWK